MTILRIANYAGIPGSYPTGRSRYPAIVGYERTGCTFLPAAVEMCGTVQSQRIMFVRGPAGEHPPMVLMPKRRWVRQNPLHQVANPNPARGKRIGLVQTDSPSFQCFGRHEILALPLQDI